jgi:Flp pilus assembly protein TadD
MAAIEPKPVAAVVVAAEPKPSRAATPVPFSPMTLPAWPPSNGFEDWDNPQSAATSVSNRVTPSRAVSSDFKPEDSVIVDLNAKPTATPSTDKPRRPQTAPVIQTSEQTPSTSGVFVMPTAAQPNATPVAPEAPELPPPPVVLAAAPSPSDGDRASSPGWNTPLPERLPGEPIAAPAAPSWPSAAGLVYEPHAPIVHESAAPIVLRRAVFRSRGVVIGVAAAAVIAIVVAVAALGSHGSSDSKQATIVATSASKATAPVDSTATHATRPGAGTMPAPATTAAVEAVTPPPKSPVKAPVATRRFSRSRKPVVVDYDKKPSSPVDVDEALAQARAAYANGNQHLFAGEGREAVAEYRRALSIYPSYAAGYRGLGLAFAQLDEKPSAIAAFKTYVKLAPTAKDVALIQKRIRNLAAR